MAVERDDEQQTVDVVLGERPAEASYVRRHGDRARHKPVRERQVSATMERTADRWLASSDGMQGVASLLRASSHSSDGTTCAERQGDDPFNRRTAGGKEVGTELGHDRDLK